MADATHRRNTEAPDAAPIGSHCGQAFGVVFAEGVMDPTTLARLLDRYGQQLSGILTVQAGFVDLLDEQRAELERLRERVRKLERWVADGASSND
jgi:hypothetical protein